MMLVIQPFGHIEGSVIKHLKKNLAPYFDEITVNEEVPVMDEAYNHYRQQYLVDPLLQALKPIKAEKVLGIVDRDLYTPNQNFIFGLAKINGKDCIIALERLRDESSRKVFLDRVLKEARHELGHAYGLRHCPQKGCVMHFSNSLGDTDVKKSVLCKDCEDHLDQV